MSAPVVYLHPIGLDARVWQEVAGPEDRCLDFPGFGHEPFAGDVTLDALARYVVDHLDAPATLAGLSLGGMVAQQVAVRYPESIVSLVVACSTPASKEAVMRQRAVDTRSQGMEGVLAVTLDRWFTPAALAAPDHPGVSYARERLLADDPGVVAAYWEAMAEHDVTEQLSQVRLPTTVIAGAQDQASSIEGLTLIADRVADGVLEVLDGPHMLPLEHPREFAAAMARHQARLAG